MGKKRAKPAPAKPAAVDNARLLAYGTLPLRIFLGLTFVYAGLQKISDPGFLQPGSATYIGTQLQSFVGHSPIYFLLQWFALPDPQLAGVGVIAAELIIGALVMLGIATRWAAAAGALLSFVLFLTASWTVQPYFLGSDSIYTVAWITLMLVGDQGLLTLRPLLFETAATARGRAPLDQGRRRLLLQLGAGAVALVWVLALLPRTRGSTAAIARSSPTSTPPAGETPSPAASPSSAASPTGTRIGTTSDLSGGSFTFSDPTTGDPGVVVKLSGGSVVAFDTVCTHAGCTVTYDASQRLLTCPCHGAQFDPAHAAAVVTGPAVTPLAAIKIQVISDGSIYTA
ncbi:MAG TPA: TQO small subunit DoxD [Candidatus Dormibacteraeota bacterium]|nr:TQO small subunit DoxD [Candidatus Dormibacteraeota bacterium]